MTISVDSHRERTEQPAVLGAQVARPDHAARALADRLESSAKLAGQARAYGSASHSTDEATPFVPGSRRMPIG